jgi:hypothetical protein
LLQPFECLYNFSIDFHATPSKKIKKNRRD